MKLSFTIPGVPVAQPRQRHRIVGTYVQNYTPTDSPANAFKAAVKLAASEQHNGAPLTCPLQMSLVFVMPRPEKLIWKTRPMPRIPYTSSRNDWDNLGKCVCDALNGYLYRDDGQIAVAHVERWIAAGDESPHTVVVIEALANQAHKSAV